MKKERLIAAARLSIVRMLARAFRTVEVPDGFAKLVQDLRRTTLVTKGKSVVIEALILSFARRSGVPRVLSSDELGEAADRPDNALVYVPVQDPAGIQRIVSADPNHQFVSFNTFYGRGPVRHSPSPEVSVLASVGLLFGRRILIVTLGQPLSLERMRSAPLKHLTRHLRVDFYRNLRLVRGVPFQSIGDQARIVLGGAEFERDISGIAQASGISPFAARRRARRAFFHMAANPLRVMFVLLEPLARFVIGRLFTRVTTLGVERFRTAAMEHPVILLPMHRSHFDYILLAYKLYEAKLNTPLVAAGSNLSFWPIGFILRSVGGYYVRRDARGDRLHALLLRRYVTYLLKRGHLQEFFIEGGRSRSGKMRHPKVGLLKIFTEAYLQGVRRDILFVPVGITYEYVVEDKVFGDENTGQAKLKEDLFALFRALKIFQKKYGDVVISFGEPIALSSIAQGKPAESRAIVSALARTATFRIRDQTSPSLTNLAYTAILMSPRYGVSRTTLVRGLLNLGRIIDWERERQPDLGIQTPALQAFLKGKHQLLDELPRGGVVQRAWCLGEEVFCIPGQKRYMADFYRNSILHLLSEMSLLSILDLLNLPLSSVAVAPFYRLLAHDLLLPEESSFRASFDLRIRRLTEQGILSNRDGELRFAERQFGMFLPGVLLSTLQSYLWVYYNLGCFSNGERNIEPVEQDLSPSKFIRKLQDDFKTASYLGLVSRTEAASHSALSAVVESLTQRGVLAFGEGRAGARPHAADMRAEAELLRRANDAILHWFAATIAPTATSAEAPLSLPIHQ